MSIKSSEQYIKQFWERHIASFEVCHGTTSLYYNHFKEQGLSASYPKPLVDLVAKIRILWNSHQDIKPMTGYFQWFLNRFDRAQAENAVEYSFSANQQVQHEFTTGSRHGGEWMRELRSFIAKALGQEHLFSQDEKLVLKEAQALIDVVSELPVMKVKINPTCSKLAKMLGEKSLFLPLEKFKNYVEKNCLEMEIQSYLDKKVLPALYAEKRQLLDQDELVLTRAVSSEFLSFEFIETLSTKKTPNLSDFPKLEFDQPTILSTDEIVKLSIDRSGLSNLDEYSDSKFDVEVLKNNQYRVTRRVSSDQNIEKEFRKKWLAAFKVK
ncbi:MAG: hypothetical protein KBA81_04055 [Rhabdochlamydiaceae bacterium]|nr:hypothetical protein [Rhabdochlamydiaceae bacterium]